MVFIASAFISISLCLVSVLSEATSRTLLIWIVDVIYKYLICDIFKLTSSVMYATCVAHQMRFLMSVYMPCQLRFLMCDDHV